MKIKIDMKAVSRKTKNMGKAFTTMLVKIRPMKESGIWMSKMDILLRPGTMRDLSSKVTTSMVKKMGSFSFKPLTPKNSPSFRIGTMAKDLSRRNDLDLPSGGMI